MPKKAPVGAPKKARWTASKKKAAGAATKTSTHRGKREGGSYAERTPSRDPRTRGSKPDRFERKDRFERRDDTRGDNRGERFDERRPARGPHGPRDGGARPARYERPRFDEKRGGGWTPREDRRDDRGDSRGERREWTPRNDRRDERTDNRGEGRGWIPRNDRRDDSRGERREWTPRNDRRDDNRGERREWAPREDRRDFRRDDNRGGSERGGFDRGARGFDRRDERRPAPRRDDHRGFAAYEPEVDPEAERMEADTWVKATRKEVDGPLEVSEDNGFAALGLPERIVERLAREGITQPFPIQQATMADALAGKDLLGRGRTGSGKTLAFGIPALTRLAERKEQDGRVRPRQPRAIVMVPTRELAMQVSDALEPLVHVMGLRHKLVAGGLSYTGQIGALDKGIDLLVATPGRLADLAERGAVEFDDVSIMILDEADHMSEMGFFEAITGILDQIPAGQRMLFSATLDHGIDKLVDGYLTDPVTHSTDDATAAVTTMSHHVLLIEPMHKKVITAAVANRPGRTIVFCRTKLGADRIAEQLREQGVMAAALHGGLGQSARNRVLGAFRDGSLRVLVATDVAARGIHVDDVSLVLQVDPPADHKDYLHRAGRTARAGEEGTVVTLALPHQRRTMERQLGEAGVDTKPVKAVPGDEVISATGATPPSGVPIPEIEYKRLLEGPKRDRAPRGGHRGGPRGGHGGGRGGFRGGRDGGRDFGGRDGGRGGYRGGRDGGRDFGGRDGGRDFGGRRGGPEVGTWGRREG